MKGQKRLAADILKCSPKRLIFDSSRMEEIKEAITKADVRKLIKSKAIIRIPKRGISRARARETAGQVRKGRKHGQGSRKGKRKARIRKKDEWKSRVRLQRNFLRELKKNGKIGKDYRKLYLKIKGGFFRSKRHMKLLIGEQK